ncbi:hypothetical protein N0V88_000371 [Collariella sp. IMI 366227]|nr:hypothetical protein N0V88_000371 [Collariella sp. IMI 366227]
MASSPPQSPVPARPLSAMVRAAPRSNSRMSVQSKTGGGSRASDEDTRTAVKVGPEDPGYELIPQRFQRSMVQVHSPTSLSIESPQGRKLFVFDRVFEPEVDQAGVWDYLEECINAFTQGYNVSVLAYGQSGAGKSYTMGTSGPSEQDDPAAMGVIPRAANALFERLDGAPPKATNPNRNSMSQLRAPSRYSMQPASIARLDKNWTLRASYVEIYNEQLRDLLVPDHVPPHERGNVTIREDVKGNILLTGLHQVEVNSVEDLMNVLNQGSTLRQTDATAINARSSRSHAVFSLNLGGDTLVTTDSKMHFVDLAGSERLKNTGAQGERAKEGISINGGLAALGKVISQLSSRQPGSHVSYRDSKLTRLLQDSLGGNAITYMVACVTPAEFHLSETLNTVQYAQRARAIQSKPRIQQVEEGDKQAIIDRLKAEVAFLREQIRSAERGGGNERRPLVPGERSERQNEREVELQNRLLDSEENYKALGQRHAKLIAEMAKARDNEIAENQHHHDDAAHGDSATERLNRSNSFAQAVEQVVLEGSLLEKETKCAYTETINNQLQARLTKLMDREASTENYLHDLEAKLDGHTSGEEKNATIIMELRKEIARVRENEAGCEDYISTLEERLAEADQDAELMQREIDRLEQVVERQRSLGKLDSLLHELDNIQQDAQAPEAENGLANGAGHRRTASRSIAEHSRSQSHNSRHSQMEETIPESGEEDIPEEAEEQADEQKPTVNATTPKPSHTHDRTSPDYAASPAQSKFVADKLENVTQELVHLRVEHESTLNEYDLLQAKYDEALRTLAELQDAVDEARHPHRPRDSMLSVTSPLQNRPLSLMTDARVHEANHGAQTASRSLSSELSSAESPVNAMGASTSTTQPKHDSHASTPTEASNADQLALEIDRLKSLSEERESAERELATRYAQLENQHQLTLDMVEELKTQVAKAQAANSESSSPRGNTPVIRRKSSQNVMIIDRAHRSFASLRNIAAENFEHQPDTMQNFELNLNAAMHELHARSERIQELEADVATAKREMETKMTIISGLTRERSSLKATSPMDMTMVSNLRSQLEQSEMRLRSLADAHAARERELEAQVSDLRTSLDNATAAAEEAVASAQAAQEALESSKAEQFTTTATPQTAPSQAAHARTASELQHALAQAKFAAEEAAAAAREESSAEIAQREAKVEMLAVELREWEERHAEVVRGRVGEMEQQHLATRKLLEMAARDRDEASGELEVQRGLVAKLRAEVAALAASRGQDEEGRIEEDSEVKAQGALVAKLQAEVVELEAQKELVRELEAKVADLETQKQLIAKLQAQVAEDEAHKGLIAELEAKVADLESQKELIAKLQDQLADDEMHKDLIIKLQTQVADDETHKALIKKLEAQVADMETQKELVAELQAKLADDEMQKDLITKLEAKVADLEKQEEVISKLQAQVADDDEIHKDLITKLEAQVADHELQKELVAQLQAQVAEQEQQKELIATLQAQIAEHDVQKGLIIKLEAQIANLEAQEELVAALQAQVAEQEKQKGLIAKLEAGIVEHEEAIKAHQESVRQLHAQHAQDIEDIKASSREDLELELAAVKAEHANHLNQLEGELTEAREDLMHVATQVAFALGLDVSVEKLSERIDELVSIQTALAQEQQKTAELERHVMDLSNINDTVMRDLENVRANLEDVLEVESEQAKSPYPVKDQVAMVRKKVLDLETKNKKNSRLVEELEDQLQSNYDQVQMASNRLSTLQMERNAKLEEANAAKIKLQGELDTIREEYATLQAKYDGILASPPVPDAAHRPESPTLQLTHTTPGPQEQLRRLAWIEKGCLC